MTTATATAPEIKITAEPGPNPATFRFTVDRPVLAGGGVRFGSKAEAAGQPLPEALFAIPTVSSVQIAENVVTVMKDGADEWLPVARQIGAAIRRQLQSGVPAVNGDVAKLQESAAAEAKAKIAAVFESTVNPAIASHGGHVEMVDYKNNILYVRLSGGCQGCASSTATLKHGIERMVRDAVPDVVDIVDVTDHAGGTNPYYSH